MKERHRQIPANSVKELLAQRGDQRRNAVKNFVSHWANVQTVTEVPAILSIRDILLDKIRVLDNGKVARPEVVRDNNKDLQRDFEMFGEKAIRKLLPTDVYSYAWIMNLLRRNGIWTRDELISTDLRILREERMVGEKAIKIIDVMKQLADYDIRSSYWTQKNT